MARWKGWLALAAFLGLAIPLIAFLSADWGPSPLYLRYRSDPNQPPCVVTPSTSVSVSFQVPPARTPDRFAFPLQAQPAHPLQVSVLDERSGKLLARQEFTHSGVARVELDALGEDTERLSIRFESRTRDPELAPRILWVPIRPLYSGRVQSAGKPVASRSPLLLLEYDWPSRHALYLWGLAGLVVVVAFYRRRCLGPALVVLGLACLATSALLWRQHFSLSVAHGDADSYGKSARYMAEYLQVPERRAEIAEWWHGYPHTHNCLAPLVLSVPVLLGAAVRPAYVLLMSLCGFLSLVLVFRCARQRLGLSFRVALACTVGFACHLSVLRAFGRPVTDVLGLVLWVWSIDLLLQRMERVTRAQSWSIAALTLLHPLARPQGPSLLLFLFLGFCLAERWREGAWPWRDLLRRTLLLFVAPGLLLTAVYFGFGWFHNVELMMIKASRYRFASTPQRYLESLLATFQLLPLLMVFAWGGPARKQLNLLLFALVYYLAVLALVRAPFMFRHFLPAVPLVYWVAGLGLERLRPRARAFGIALIGVLAAANVGLVTYQVLNVPEVIFFHLLD